MNENEFFDELMNRLVQKLKPVISEVVNEGLAQIKTKPPVPDNDDLCTTKDLMKLFGGCAKSTVYSWRKKGLIKSKKIGNKTFFKKSEIEKLLK